ncbi:alpha/beta-hydrolase [Biscogniauxia mediterranea]|nr:alpha/beta-hydrolase [Biscogniauxia mediterranea]
MPPPLTLPPHASLLSSSICRRSASIPVLSFGLLLAAGLLITSARTRKTRAPKPHPYTPAPRSREEASKSDHPYPPDALPGGRDVATPYGSVRVYEWGPADGPRVLFVHGISTPTVSLGDLAHEMVGKGCRVMLFDLFGRGYSDAPSGLPYDARLYTAQMLLVLASSPLAVSWTSAPGFHLVGYSLGGGLCVAFARHLPHLVRSLALVAPCGLIRPRHVGWRSWLYYTSGLLPEVVVRELVRRRIRPQESSPATTADSSNSSSSSADILTAESLRQVSGDGDANGGAGFDSAAISKYRPGVTVSSVVRWQVDNHAGFLTAFLSSIRNCPIYAPQPDWEVLSSMLEIRRTSNPDVTPNSGLDGGKVLIVLGEHDSVIVKDETIEDATAVLGPNGVEFAVIDGGHEVPITRSTDVANAIEEFWRHGG